MQFSAFLPGGDDLVDEALDRLWRAVTGPVVTRRELRRLRGPRRALRCAIAGTLPDGRTARWREGLAVLAPGSFTFLPADGGAPVRLGVTAVVDTRYTRIRDHGAGPRTQAVSRLRTAQDTTLLWSAHRTLLDEGATVLRGPGAGSGPHGPADVLRL